MKKICLFSLLLITSLPLWAEADLGRLVPLGFSIPEERSKAPELEAWREGEKVSLVPGEKPVLLYFWGSHVPGSIADLNRLDDLSEELNCRDIIIAPVNLNDEPSLVSGYAEEAELSLTLYLFPESPALDPYIMKSVPALWLIDRQGRVAAACEGNVPWSHPDLLRSLREFICE